DSSAGNLYKGLDLNLIAFNRIFGLELHRDSSVSVRYTGMFDFRVFGFYDQGTNITLQAGVRSVDLGGVSARNAVLGLRTDFYLARGFGLHGLYRHFYESTPNLTGSGLLGERWEGGGFLEFSILRLYGNYLSEPETQT